VRQGVLRVEGSDFVLTPHGTACLQERGVDVPTARSRRRVFARRCLDWSERRDHVSGALGAAIFTQWEAQDWIVRDAHGRAVVSRPRAAPSCPPRA
jgi:hypothetical protein